MNLGVKRFPSMLKNKGSHSYFRVSQAIQVNSLHKKSISSKEGLRNSKHPGLKESLCKYDMVLQDELPDESPPKRSVDHANEVDRNSKPPQRPPFQLSPLELDAAKKYVEELLPKGKIRPSKSPYGALLFFVKDNDKPMLVVVDYCALNSITKRNNAPLPRSHEMFDRLGGACNFSKLDLKTGFHQNRVKPEDIKKTAFNTKYGQYEYLVMPMGLCNTPATFKSLMNCIFYDFIDDFLFFCMVQLLIFSKDEKIHLKHIETVLSRLKDDELYVSPKKREFLKESMEFLEFIV